MKLACWVHRNFKKVKIDKVLNILPNSHSKVISGCPTSPPKNEHNELRKATNAIKATTMAVIFRTNMAAVEAPVHKILHY